MPAPPRASVTAFLACGSAKVGMGMRAIGGVGVLSSRHVGRACELSVSPLGLSSICSTDPLTTASACRSWKHSLEADREHAPRKPVRRNSPQSWQCQLCVQRSGGICNSLLLQSLGVRLLALGGVAGLLLVAARAGGLAGVGEEMARGAGGQLPEMDGPAGCRIPVLPSSSSHP
jgi:hypothetical protein